jgi:nucleotide-binding universal stress UspA family protein
MTVTIFIAAESPAEMSALITEGAPEANMAFRTLETVMTLYGLDFTESGECDADEWLSGYAEATQWAWTDLEKIRVEEVHAVAKAAQALGRRVRWG